MRHYPCMTVHTLHTATDYLGKTTTPILHLVMVVATSVLLLHPAPASRPVRRRHRRHGRRRGGRCAARRHRHGGGSGGAARGGDRRRRGVLVHRAAGRRLRRHGGAARFRRLGGRGLGRGRRHCDGVPRPADRAAAGNCERHRGGADHLRVQRRRRADAGPAGGHHQRDRGRRQPAGRFRPGRRRLRVRRLVQPGRRPRLPDEHQRGADRHHHRRVPERHVRLLERLQGEPLRRPGEPGAASRSRRGRPTSHPGRWRRWAAPSTSSRTIRRGSAPTPPRPPWASTRPSGTTCESTPERCSAARPTRGCRPGISRRPTGCMAPRRTSATIWPPSWSPPTDGLA